MSRGRRRRLRNGLTIVELGIVLALVTAVASAAIPSYFARPRVTLDAAAELLEDDLEYVQDHAAFLQETILVHFDPDGTGYRMTTTDGWPLLSPYGTGPFVRDYPRDAVFRGVAVDDVELGGRRALAFRSDGTAGGDARVVLSYRGEVRVVRLAAPEGHVTIR